MFPRRWASAATLCLALLFALPASAAKRLTIVGVQTPPSLIGLGGQVTRKLAETGRRQGYQVISPEDLQSALGDEAYARVAKCGVDASCVAAALGNVASGRAVTGTLDRDERNYRLRLSLIDLSTGTEIASVDRAILIASRRFPSDVDEVVPRLLRGEREAKGRVRITANVSGATVFVDGQAIGQTPLAAELKPGRYEVRVEKKHYLATHHFLDVQAEQTTTDEFRLLLEPGATAEEVAQEEQGGAPKVTKAAPQGPALAVNLPSQIALGTAVVAAAAGAGFGYSALHLQRALEAGYDPTTQLYKGTRAEALLGQQRAKTANVCYGVAGVAALTGVALAVFLHGDEAAATVAPTEGGGAGLWLEGRF